MDRIFQYGMAVYAAYFAYLMVENLRMDLDTKYFQKAEREKWAKEGSERNNLDDNDQKLLNVTEDRNVEIM